MHNFSINMPSIPTGSIQFKIQDAKFKGFSSKETRFKDNMSYLTSHFINTFPNIKPTKPIATEKDSSITNSQISTSLSRNFQKQNDNYRLMIGDDKKNLLLKYEEEYKDYVPDIPLEKKYDKGYSFGKSCIRDALDFEIQKIPAGNLGNHKESVIDNYYFNNKTEESIDEDEDDKIKLEKRREENILKRRVVKKSAVFESEDRWKSLGRQISSKIKPGPGSYEVKAPSSWIIKKTAPAEKKNNQSVLLERIKQIMDRPANPEKKQEKAQQNMPKGFERRSSMFVQGNLDRFGEQHFPVSPKLNVPGPGAYRFLGTLEDRANQILVVEEQRKLLKQWYND